jgi:ribosome-associated heat shock protein Hsp15
MSPAEPTSVRVDRWLWSVRVFRSRTAATDACGSGRVTVNGEPAKPATKVAVGDQVQIRRKQRTTIYLVTGLLLRRVSASAAATCFDDLTPPEPDPSPHLGPATATRDRGAGRPTKRDRRRIDELRGRP